MIGNNFQFNTVLYTLSVAANPQKYINLNGSFVFNLYNIFQKCNSGRKQDLCVCVYTYKDSN